MHLQYIQELFDSMNLIKNKYHTLYFQTNGISNGLLPMLRVYNNTARYVDQGGNKVITFTYHMNAN